MPSPLPLFSFFQLLQFFFFCPLFFSPPPLPLNATALSYVDDSRLHPVYWAVVCAVHWAQHNSHFCARDYVEILRSRDGPSLLCRVNLWGRWQEHDWNVPTIPWMTSQHTSLQRDTSYSQQYNMIHQHINTQQPIVQIYHLLTLQGSGWNCVGFFKQCVIHNA